MKTKDQKVISNTMKTNNIMMITIIMIRMAIIIIKNTTMQIHFNKTKQKMSIITNKKHFKKLSRSMYRKIISKPQDNHKA